MQEAEQMAMSIKVQKELNSAEEKTNAQILALTMTAELKEEIKELRALVASSQTTNKGGNTKKKAFPNKLKTAGPPPDHTVPTVINGISYWYCTAHGKWGKHSTAECHKLKAESNISDASTQRTQRAISAMNVTFEADSD